MKWQLFCFVLQGLRFCRPNSKRTTINQLCFPFICTFYYGIRSLGESFFSHDGTWYDVFTDPSFSAPKSIFQFNGDGKTHLLRQSVNHATLGHWKGVTHFSKSENILRFTRIGFLNFRRYSCAQHWFVRQHLSNPCVTVLTRADVLHGNCKFQDKALPNVDVLYIVPNRLDGKRCFGYGRVLSQCPLYSTLRGTCSVLPPRPNAIAGN
jgi:hypothetical protein